MRDRFSRIGGIAPPLCLSTLGYIYSVFFIFIYNPTFGQRRFTKKNWMGSGNWPSVLGNTLAVLMKGNEFARYPTANLRACRLSTASFRTVPFFFPLRFLNLCPRFCCFMPYASRELQFHLFSIPNFRTADSIMTTTRIFSVHTLTARLTHHKCQFLSTHILYNIYLYLKTRHIFW